MLAKIFSPRYPAERQDVTRRRASLAERSHSDSASMGAPLHHGGDCNIVMRRLAAITWARRRRQPTAMPLRDGAGRRCRNHVANAERMTLVERVDRQRCKRDEGEGNQKRRVRSGGRG